MLLISLLVGVPVLLLTEASSRGADGNIAHSSRGMPWSRMPPAGLKPAEVPQFVAITFDDNFGLEAASAVGGIKSIVEYYAGKHNPMGTGSAADFDGAPIRATFFDTSIYMVDSNKRVFGGKKGEDQNGRNRAAWRFAVAAGHEIADHTVNHFNGGSAVPRERDCCQTGNWSVAHWTAEIASCRTTLTDARFGLGAKDVIGFRAPFLSYNDHLFTALQTLAFAYDSSVPNCFDDAEDGTNCSWPYSLHNGSPDTDAFARKLTPSDAPHPISLATFQTHPGSLNSRSRPSSCRLIPSAAATTLTPVCVSASPHALLFPIQAGTSASSGKITGLAYTLLIDPGLTEDEMRAIFGAQSRSASLRKRSPLSFVAHAHLYAFSDPEDNLDTPQRRRPQGAIKRPQRIHRHASTKPEVRVVATRDVLARVQAALSRKP